MAFFSAPFSILLNTRTLQSFLMIRQFLLCLLWAASASALFFHLGESDKKCFFEEVPEETVIVGVYRVEMYDPNLNHYAPQQGLGMHVEVKDSNEDVILSRTYSAEGRFTFTTHLAGEHTICLHTNSSAWFGRNKLRVHLEFQVGDHAINYQEMQPREKLSELQLRVRQLIDQAETIQKEQAYQRVREERFRATSESTNQRVLWWSLAQTTVLLCTGYWQIHHLKSFFRQKKLV